MQIIDRRRRGYYTCDHSLVKDYGRELGAHGVAVYNVLASYVNREQVCWPSCKTVGDMIGISRPTVTKAIEKLESLNIIHVKRRWKSDKSRDSHLITLLDVSIWGCKADLQPLANEVDNGCKTDSQEQAPGTKRQINNKRTNTKNKGNSSRKTWYSDEESQFFNEHLP